MESPNRGGGVEAWMVIEPVLGGGGGKGGGVRVGRPFEERLPDQYVVGGNRF